jgi:rod shape-determining protein MreC
MLKGIHQQLDPHESPAFFIQGPRPFSRLMFFCALSLVMMAIDARFDYLSQVRQWFSAALHPLEIVASAPNEWGRNINTYFTSHNQLIQENFKLKQQGLIDNAALQRLATVDAENVHLRTLLAGDAPIIPKATLGEVMHMGRDPFSNIITLNRGSHHDITPGQAVVDEQGVVGQITRVYPFTSEVTLITDKKLSIPIQIERNQLRAIAFGEGKRNTLDIPYLPTSVDIKVGDKLVTSGIDGVYPAGLAVAVVTQIKQSQDSPFAKIVSRPIAGVNNHKHVLILKIPESPAINPVTDNKPVLPRNNAQHLDQSVVDVLQKNNAAVDPHPITEIPSLDSTDTTPAPETAVMPPTGATPNGTQPNNNQVPTAPEHP